jgi:hypothetical protein
MKIGGLARGLPMPAAGFFYHGCRRLGKKAKKVTNFCEITT